ncbi:hypothetical protein ABK040_002183 [Willaertia magna]
MSHRLVNNPAKATDTQGGFKRWVPTAIQSVYEVNSYKKLKVRQPGQNTLNEISHKDLKKELAKREEQLKNNKDIKAIQDLTEKPSTSSSEDFDKKLLEEEIPSSLKQHQSIKRREENDSSDSDSSDSDSESDEEDSSDDENAELARELAKIQKEKELKAKIERQERALTSNPLLKPTFLNQKDQNEEDNEEEEFTLKRRWTDNTIFKNQAKSEKEQELKKKKRFINDTTRNDYHKDFMDRFMK